MSTPFRTHPLAQALFSRTQQAVLRLLFLHPGETYHIRGIVRLTQISPGTVLRELKRLTAAGILLRTLRDTQPLYQANSECPIYPELRGLVIKTLGIAEELRAALAPLADNISVAFLYGSVARGTETNHSDVDVMVIGEVSLRQIMQAIGPLQEAYGREINPSVFPVAEYRDRLENQDHFLSSLVSEPKIFLLGNDDELTRLGR